MKLTLGNRPPKKPPLKLETLRSRLFFHGILDLSPDHRPGASLASYATTIGITVILISYLRPIPPAAVERVEIMLATLLLAGVWLYKTWVALAYSEQAEKFHAKGAEDVVKFMRLCERYCWFHAGFGFWGVGLGTYLIIRQESSLVVEALMVLGMSLLLWQLVKVRRAVEKLRPVIEAYNNKK